MIRLQFNENFFIEQEWAQKILHEAIQDLDPREYPPMYGSAVRKALSNFHNIPEERLIIGNGAIEILDIITSVFTQNSCCLVVQPTFGVYEKYTERKGGRCVNFLLNQDFSLDIKSLFEKLNDEIKIIFLSSPNNPTGNQFPPETIQELLEISDIPVVIDEAYADFASYSVLDWEYNNLIVIRSFSKSAAAAGMRLGYAIADEKVIEQLKDVQSLFQVNSVAQNYIVKVLENYEYIQRKIEELKLERANLYTRLTQIEGIQVYPSDASFFLCRILNISAKYVIEQLKLAGILVADWSETPLLENCIRVSLGTPSMNTKFVTALESTMKIL